MKVPVSSPDITRKDIHAVVECLESNWISGVSPAVEHFENKFAEYIGVPKALVTGSGTTALHLACAALKIGLGDEVIMPAFTMASSANSVIYQGARPVFVDSLPDTWCIDPEKIKEVITNHTAAIMPVHIYGHPAPMKQINEIAQAHSLAVIEDAAESHGAEIAGMGKTGSMGDIGCFSLYANKILTTGEGGVMTFNHEPDYVRAHWLRAHAFGRHGRHYWHEEVGFGYRMSGMQAALGASQLERVGQYVAKRREAAELYKKGLIKYHLDGMIDFPAEHEGYRNVYWMFSILLRDTFPVSRLELMEELEERGVETRTFFYPLHTMPPYRAEGVFPVAEDIAKRGLNLPSGNLLTPEQIRYVCDCIKEIAG